MAPQSNGTESKVRFYIEPEVREMLDRYVAEQNVLMKPLKLTISAVVNDAIREYVTRRAARNEQEAA
jgi:hypothetical protein